VSIQNRNRPELNCDYLTNNYFVVAALLQFSNSTIKQQQMSVYSDQLMPDVNHHLMAKLTVIASDQSSTARRSKQPSLVR